MIEEEDFPTRQVIQRPQEVQDLTLWVKFDEVLKLVILITNHLLNLLDLWVDIDGLVSDCVVILYVSGARRKNGDEFRWDWLLAGDMKDVFAPTVEKCELVRALMPLIFYFLLNAPLNHVFI